MSLESQGLRMVREAFLIKLYATEGTSPLVRIVYVMRRAVVVFSVHASAVLRERNTCCLCHELLSSLNPLADSCCIMQTCFRPFYKQLKIKAV